MHDRDGLRCFIFSELQRRRQEREMNRGKGRRDTIGMAQRLYAMGHVGAQEALLNLCDRMVGRDDREYERNNMGESIMEEDQAWIMAWQRWRIKALSQVDGAPKCKLMGQGAVDASDQKATSETLAYHLEQNVIRWYTRCDPPSTVIMDCVDAVMQKGDAQNSCRLLQAYLMPDGSQPGRIRVNGDLACLWRLYCLDVLPACGRWDEAKALLEKEDPMSQFWSNENERQDYVASLNDRYNNQDPKTPSSQTQSGASEADIGIQHASHETLPKAPSSDASPSDSTIQQRIHRLLELVRLVYADLVRIPTSQVDRDRRWHSALVLTTICTLIWILVIRRRQTGIILHWLRDTVEKTITMVI